MIKGKVGEWYQDDHIGGIIREDGTVCVYEEYGLSDADTGLHFVDVQNGLGYYDNDGRFRRYSYDPERQGSSLFNLILYFY